MPWGPRDDAALLDELNELSRHHLAGCPEYAAMWPSWTRAGGFDDLPWVHVGAFKHLDLRTHADGIQHGRVLASSATSGVPSRIALDDRSSERQAASSEAILSALVGARKRPLLILDHAGGLRRRDGLPARIAAAMALKPLASELHFLLGTPDDPASVRNELLAGHDDVLLYGFTWMLWLAAERLDFGGARVQVVHSGGWKRLEALAVDHAEFEARVLATAGEGSRVWDCYGLVEQVGVLFPLCEAGYRHAPRWAEVLVRDPWTLETLPEGVNGMLQLLNSLPIGAPYHSVLTEDVGHVEPGACPCGRAGRRFVLAGRVPKAEVRGCANV
jgi:hypothetical protein